MKKELLLHEIECRSCGFPFVPAVANALYCTPNCKRREEKRRREQRAKDLGAQRAAVPQNPLFAKASHVLESPTLAEMKNVLTACRVLKKENPVVILKSLPEGWETEPMLIGLVDPMPDRPGVWVMSMSM